MPNPNSLLDEHVILTCRCMDRIFLNGYVPKLQQPDQLFWFLCQHRGEEIPRYDLLGEITRDFVAAVHEFAEGGIPVITFESKRKSGKRKDDIAKPYFEQAAAQGREGVVLIGIAQERADCFRPPPKRQRVVGRFAASRNSAFVKHIYLYIWDSDFGPAFIKFCTYAPFSGAWPIRRVLRGSAPTQARSRMGWPFRDGARLRRVGRSVTDRGLTPWLPSRKMV